jgi:hypothetical protein
METTGAKEETTLQQRLDVPTLQQRLEESNDDMQKDLLDAMNENDDRGDLRSDNADRDGAEREEAVHYDATTELHVTEGKLIQCERLLAKKSLEYDDLMHRYSKLCIRYDDLVSSCNKNERMMRQLRDLVTGSLNHVDIDSHVQADPPPRLFTDTDLPSLFLPKMVVRHPKPHSLLLGGHQ